MYAPKNVVLVIEITKLFYSLQEISVRLGFFFFFLHIFVSFWTKIGQCTFSGNNKSTFYRTEQNQPKPLVFLILQNTCFFRILVLFKALVNDLYKMIFTLLFVRNFEKGGLCKYCKFWIFKKVKFYTRCNFSVCFKRLSFNVECDEI